jgi:glucose-6-phosphate isomerase
MATPHDRLAAHAERVRGAHLRELFVADPDRGTRLQVEAAGWLLDYSKHRVTAETVDHLVEVAGAHDLRGWIDRMFRGQAVNTTEGRPALHVALRAPAGTVIEVDGVNVVPAVHSVRARMAELARAVRAGEWRGHTGRPVRNVVNIGIGGSDLGPAMAARALVADTDRRLQLRFVSNVDGADLVESLWGLDPAETLFIVSSKTFTTVETITNAESAREWLLGAFGGDPAAVSRHFVAVSTNADRVRDFGIDPRNMFEFWDWVGGRYSLWSAIGLSLMIAVGPEAFDELLAGAHEMDEHFRTADLDRNLPVLLGLLAWWCIEFLGAQSQAVVPYADVLDLLPAYLQQLEMESNGKSVTRSGAPVEGPTGAVVWGTPGTNGQHAYFQLLHQGTVPAPVDFIGFLRPNAAHAVGRHHELLVANLLAQAEALAFGKTADEVVAEGVPAELVAHRTFPGNRPSSVLLADRLDARSLGAILAAYEHKVFTLGVLWEIDSFDQWGVELGKQLAGRIAAELGDQDLPLAHDSSTNSLIRRYRAGTL